jgi:hypothetical protein
VAEEQVVDTGTPEPAAPPPINERPADGPGSGRSELRKQLEKSVDSARKAQEPEAKPRAKGKYVSTARKEEVQGAETAAEPAEAEAEAAPAEEAAAEPAVAAPEGWAKEAKAEWENLPPAVQAAVTKREVDMAKGVEQIQKKYAEIDQVIQPRMETIRRHGHTPAQAVNQLFAWFEALSANPNTAFPALAESFKYNLRSIPGLIPQELIQLWQEKQKGGQPAQQPGTQPAADAQPAGEIPPGVQKYIDEMRQELAGLKEGFTNQLGQLSTSFQQQSQAKTEEILANWSKDKPYFEDVRRTMIASQEVPPLPNGAADLDRAYDMALWANPEIREKLRADERQKADAELKAKQAAERKAQQEQADKARRVQGGSLTAGAPGAPTLPVKGKKGKSVSESLREAISELRE